MKNYWFINILSRLYEFIKDILPINQSPQITKPMEPTPAPIVEDPTVTPPATPGMKLYTTARGYLGKDASPNDVAPDEYGCAETVNDIYKDAFGQPICLPGILTTQLYYEMLRNPIDFKSVITPEPGDIIISPTGLGNGALKNGHVGIVGIYGILSNNSNTGNLSEDYTLEKWNARYKEVGGFPVLFFRPV